MSHGRATIVPALNLCRAAMALLLPLLTALAGCKTMLPSGATSTPVPWTSYAQAHDAIDRIEPYKTTRQDLRREAIDPTVNPSITILSYTDLLQRLTALSAVPSGHLERGLEDCLDAGRRCTAYSIDFRQVKTHRVGNFWLDMLNFRRHTVTTGWSLSALIIFIDDQAVYALAGGQPNVNGEQDIHNPLGPLQGLGEAIHPTIF